MLEQFDNAQGLKVVFESAVCALSGNDRVNAMNPCRVCHARVLAEQLESAPIF